MKALTDPRDLFFLAALLDHLKRKTITWPFVLTIFVMAFFAAGTPLLLR